MKNLFLILFAISNLLCADINAQELMKYQQPKEYEMPPKLIPTARKYWVSLPKDYDEKKNSYPIVFLFDGNEAYLRNLILFDIDQLTDLGEIPPCIIVGIMQRNRALDFGPLYAVKSNPNSAKVNGDKFFDFIKQELLPELQKNYRTQNFKIGIGHSLGGLFLLNSFTKDPDFFNGIIAVSPALEMNRDSTLFSNVKKTLHSKINKQTFFAGHQAPKVSTK
ncbi:alpha/beta hydrolase [Mucilaginibacter antarcticus]|uniref:alpha/beta hydrolase n=1 Tax=Mucilaginibacter antarcticus TaxID=1855725 RepID=UPI003626DE9A